MITVRDSGTVQQEAGNGHLVLRQAVLPVAHREPVQAHDLRQGLGHPGMRPVPGALRDLREERQDGHRAAAGRGPDTPGQEHGDLRG